MSDMVEKVARAIDPEAFDLPRDTRGAAQKWRLRTAKARKLARAAIEAMGEPTEAMQDAVECYVVGCCNMSKTDASDVWGSMIDAALKGEAE